MALRQIRWLLGWLQAKTKYTKADITHVCNFTPVPSTRSFTVTPYSRQFETKGLSRELTPFAYRRYFTSEELNCTRIM